MGSSTKIQWCDATFNPWRAGCAECYAEKQSRRNPLVLGTWGPKGTRVVASESTWEQPLAWDRAAKKAGMRRRVFCGSLMEVFEDWSGAVSDSLGRRLSVTPDGTWAVSSRNRQLTLAEVRARLFRLIDQTPDLDWLLVTKRSGNIQRLWPARADYRRENIWLLASVEDQAAADCRVPELLKCHGLARVLGLSCEPLLGPLDLRPWLGPVHADEIDAPQLPSGHPWPWDEQPWYSGLGWVIVGGESGPGARPCQIEWVRSIVQQCQAARVPCFVKQLGSLAVMYQPRPGTVLEMPLKHTKGGDPSEWPEDLNVREFPCLA